MWLCCVEVSAASLHQLDFHTLAGFGRGGGGRGAAGRVGKSTTRLGGGRVAGWGGC